MGQEARRRPWSSTPFSLDSSLTSYVTATRVVLQIKSEEHTEVHTIGVSLKHYQALSQWGKTAYKEVSQETLADVSFIV